MRTLRHLTYLLCFSLFLLSSGCSKAEEEEYFEYVQSHKQATSYYGDLSITTIVSYSGLSVFCLLSLSGVEVGAQILTSTQDTYQFDLLLGRCYAQGILTLHIGDSQQLSKVSGDFEYSAADNQESFSFKGDIIYWFADTIARNTAYGDTIITQDTIWMN